jgi:hypothetical protein
MRTILVSFVASLCLSACTKEDSGPQTSPAESSESPSIEATQSESVRLNAWFEERYEEELQFSPIQLTMLGRKERYDEFDDISEEAEDSQFEWRRESVETMEREFDYASLTPSAHFLRHLEIPVRE